MKSKKRKHRFNGRSMLDASKIGLKIVAKMGAITLLCREIMLFDE
ncbi:hypothetical protein SynNOUM97013_00855 [Synechococcus sp. NOUM97013]|nr:hypothetical protein SynNOUM97013_00855 [Synechococcus sp. NOUM97013]